MRIAILTLPLHTNYGGILQAYALQTVLERMGHEVKVLNKKRRIPINWCKYPYIVTKRFIGRYLLHRHKEILFHEITNNCKQAKIERFTSEFVDRYINSQYYRSISDLEKLGFDAIVVGSDQVWSHIHAGNICGSVINAFLPFTKGKELKRITYAASFGKDYWEYTEYETTKCRELVKQFDAISVREESAVVLCKEHLQVDASCNLDPTLLLNVEDYIEAFSIKQQPISKGNILLYFIDNDKTKDIIADKVARWTNLTPFKVNSRAEDTSEEAFALEERIQPPVEHWIRGFYDANFVVTDSFHACIFAILFNKPFIVVGNKDRGITRYQCLLEKFNLQSRFIERIDQLTPELVCESIEWETVNRDLKVYRNESLAYLRGNL